MSKLCLYGNGFGIAGVIYRAPLHFLPATHILTRVRTVIADSKKRERTRFICNDEKKERADGGHLLPPFTLSFPTVGCVRDSVCVCGWSPALGRTWLVVRDSRAPLGLELAALATALCNSEKEIPLQVSRRLGGLAGRHSLGTVLRQMVTPTEEDKGGEGTSDTDLEIRRLRLNSAFPGTLSKLGSVYPAIQWGRFYRW